MMASAQTTNLYSTTALAFSSSEAAYPFQMLLRANNEASHPFQSVSMAENEALNTFNTLAMSRKELTYATQSLQYDSIRVPSNKKAIYKVALSLMPLLTAKPQMSSQLRKADFTKSFKIVDNTAPQNSWLIY